METDITVKNLICIYIVKGDKITDTPVTSDYDSPFDLGENPSEEHETRLGITVH